MKINILLCDTFPGLLPHFIPSYVSMFTRLFDSVAQQAPEYEVFSAWEGVLPVSLHEDELYLITGSNAGAYEDKPWIKALQAWIREAHRKQIKLVGICFGHQVIAQALGGKVQKAPQGWVAGIRISKVMTEEALSYFPEGEMRLFYNHHDQVVQLPGEAIRVAASEFCTNESFRIGTHILTFQGHPEYVAPYMKHLIVNHAAGEPADTKIRALHSMDTWQHQGEVVAKWILAM